MIALILNYSAYIAAVISINWAFWISYTIYKNIHSYDFSITKAYPTFLILTIVLTIFIDVKN